MPHRIAVVSDVHGNLVALDSVLADLERVAPDLVVHGGDLVGTGPRPAEVVDRVRELGWPGVAGNWERVAAGDPPDPAARSMVMAPLLQRHTSWTVERLGQERATWLAELPLEWRDGDRVALVHAVPGNPWPIVRREASDGDLQTAFGGLDAAVAVYGHIHVPFVRCLDALTVANAGSVSEPFDGDPRASYLLLEDGVPSVRRVAFDVERAVADVHAAGMPDADWAAAVYRTATLAPPPP